MVGFCGVGRPGERYGVSTNLSVVPVPCLKDNYGYLLFDPRGDGRCAVIDASETEPVREEIKKRGLELAAILTTHHHWDHIGGNLALSEGGSVEVIAHESERQRIPAVTRTVTHGETFELLGEEVSVLHNPGHTQGGVTFRIGERAFVGDTLFCGGCGRLKEGTAEQLHHSLTQVFAVIPDDHIVYCGHEYTEANLRFAITIQSFPELEARLADVSHKRASSMYCASATLGEERRTNPFLRTHEAEIQAALGCSDAESAFAELRRRKDEFRL